MSSLIETIATRQRAHSADNAAIRPFRVSIPEAELTDLRRRITATKFPERETVNDMSQGVPLATVEKLARYWATEYDWRKVEARLKSCETHGTSEARIRSMTWCRTRRRNGTG